MKPEIVNYLPELNLTLSVSQVQTLFDSASNISLDNKLRASIVTDFVMTNPPSEELLKKLKDLYGIENFYSLFDVMRAMVQNYTLGGSTISKSVDDVLFGYSDERINYIFQNKSDIAFDFFKGAEVDISNFINPVYPH